MKGGRFKRTIVRVKTAVKIACTKQCVQVRKVKGKYVSIYSVKRVATKIKKRGRIVTVKRRQRVTGAP